MLGLSGIAGLNIADGPSAEEVTAQEEGEAEADGKLLVKVHKKEIGLGLMKDAKKATDAILVCLCILLLICTYPPPHMHVPKATDAILVCLCTLLLICMYPPHACIQGY